MKIFKAVNDYITFKQSIGMCFRSEAATLKSFCRAMGDIDICQVNPDSVHAFISGKGAVTTFWHQKFKILAGFYRFSISRGYVDSSPLTQTTPKCPEPMTPYIYTLDEMRGLIAATDSLETPMSPLQATTFRTLLLTLYSTGLRISEALSLTLVDVNTAEGLLVVRNSKFFKTRAVPTGPHLTDRLRTYSEKRIRLNRPAGENSAFFATRSGNALSYDRVRKVFPSLRNLAGIHRDSDARYQPRIHDIRHTFAVHRLTAWYREGADVQRLLPQLATYLGHVGIHETQRYLKMTPELLQEANRLFERYTLLGVSHV